MDVHPIRSHLVTTGETQAAFAARAGLSAGFLSKLLSGEERCGASSARKIVAASDGEVSFEELLE